MKILFFVHYRQAPLGPMYLSSALKKAGHETYSCLLDYKTAREAVKSYKPDVVALSMIIGHVKEYIEINRKLKEEFSFYSIAGGPNATFCPEIINEEGVDAICRGEGEIAMVEFINTLEQGGDITKIENMNVKKDGRIHENPLRPLIKDLDDLAFPDYDLSFRVNPTYLKSRPFPVMASRGCRSDCAHCFNHAYRKLYGEKAVKIRWRSPENLVRQLEDAKEKYNIKGVIILDDNIIFSNKWLEEFAELYPKRVGVPFWCLVTPTFATEKTIGLLKKAGCLSITIGIETGDEETRQQILRRKMTDEFLLSVCAMIKSHGIRLFAHNILGIPDSPIENDFKTLDFNIKCGVDYSDVNVYAPLPETDLGIYTQQSDMVCYDITNINVSPFRNISTKNVNKRETENLCDLFMVFVKLPFLRPFMKPMIKVRWRIYRRLAGKFNEFCLTSIRPHTYRKNRAAQFFVSLYSVTRETCVSMSRRFKGLSRAN
ncbi:MAG: radical SAM protein [Thermoleophilia bacterium]